MTISEALIDCYHTLILKEYDKIQACNFNFEDPNSRLTLAETKNVVTLHSVGLDKLFAERLLIQYSDQSLRTMHMDLLYRSVNARAAFWSPKIPLEFRLPKPREELIPWFEEADLEELKKILPVPVELCDILIKALREAGYPGTAFHQSYFLQKMVPRKHRCYLLVAPTASGKSLIFYLAMLSTVLLRLRVAGTKAIVLYPRKALASDQLMKSLRIISALNNYLSEKGLRKITVGIDDGDTPRSVKTEKVKKKDLFRGVKCVVSGCSGALRYQPSKNKTLLVCEKCSKVYDEIVATKGEIWDSSPDIVFSNLSALNRRLMTVAAQSLFGPTLEWIIMDEAHVYREELGGHARWLVKRILARFEALLKGDARFIISSATIYNPTVFVTKLLGLKEDEIYYEPYDKVLELSKEKRRKLTIDLIVAPNPRRSAESLAEELALLLGTWSYINSKKTLLFIDNVSEIERLHDFVVKTIILEREAHNDHIDPQRVPIIANMAHPFSWKSIAGAVSNIESKKLAQIYNYHYAELPSEERIDIEETFKVRNSGFLFSTSTLELGVDIRDIAAVLQYKVPITSESYFQRIGRTGRSNKVLRVALGILILTNLPSHIRYIFGDEYLKLINPQVEIPVAWENEEIKRQHVTFSILDVLASNKYPTYLDYKTEIKDNWLNVVDALMSLKSLVDQAKNNLSVLSNYLNQMSRDPAIIDSLNAILSAIESRVSEGLQSQPASGDVEEGLMKLRQAEDDACAALRTIESVGKELEEMILKVPLKELKDYKEKLNDAEKGLRAVLAELERLWR